jgi:hypothetical protein
VDMVPPAAITIPTTKPMRAQNLGFEVFITHRVRAYEERYKHWDSKSCPFPVRLAKNNG